MNHSSRFDGFGQQSAPEVFRRPTIATGLAMLCLLAGALATCVARADDSSDDIWVQRGRDACGRELKAAPWYNAKADSLRPVVLKQGKNASKAASKRSAENSSDRRSSDPDSSDQSWPDLNWANLSWLGILIQIGAYAILAAILIGLAWMLIRAYLERERSALKKSQVVHSEAAVDRIEALPFALESALGDLLSVARRLYAEGKYSEAIVYLFSHELIELDRHQHIRLAKGKTNRQYLRELAAKADLRSVLATTMDRFERAFFGAERLDRASFDSCWSELPRFDALLAKEPA